MYELTHNSCANCLHRVKKFPRFDKCANKKSRYFHNMVLLNDVCKFHERKTGG